MNFPSGLEWIVILVLVVLVFGVGRISKIAGELGRGIREFRQGIGGEDTEKTKPEVDEKPDQDSN